MYLEGIRAARAVCLAIAVGEAGKKGNGTAVCRVLFLGDGCGASWGTDGTAGLWVAVDREDKGPAWPVLGLGLMGKDDD